MIELLSDPHAWASLATLTILEIVLGIDNLIFLSIVIGRLPEQQRERARKIGLGLALCMRIALLTAIAWMIGLKEPIFSAFGHVVSWRDLILIGGGLFLLAKGTTEIHDTVEGEEVGGETVAASMGFVAALAQIMLLDIIFSLDSVITAVGMAQDLPVMIAAVLISVGVMLFAAKPVGDFVQRHLSVKLLALAFLLLIGVTLIADGHGFHIPKGYLYFAVAFACGVEALNIIARNRRRETV
ncbi:MAG: TerC family protein [Proteobacteria bacterium]|nr:TerC family protein [Pseudomonadota bacterium]